MRLVGVYTYVYRDFILRRKNFLTTQTEGIMRIRATKGGQILRETRCVYTETATLFFRRNLSLLQE